MGRRQLVPFLDDLRGKFSKIVFSSNLAGPYFRKYVIPRNPRTDAQVTIRTKITEASRDWQQLTANGRSFWKNYLTTYKEWYIGAAENVSPFNAFMAVASQIKQAIELGELTVVYNDSDWEKEAWVYDRTIQPTGKPPLVLKNIGSYSSFVVVYVENGLVKVKAQISLENNTMQQGDYLRTSDDRKVGITVWLSNPGKYHTSNMKPMVIRALHSNSLKIKKLGSQVATIELIGTVNPAVYTLAPRVGEYVRYTLALQTIDGPYSIIEEDITQVGI